MTLGPIEIVVLGFESGNFTGEIVAELETLVNAGTISIIDGLFVNKVAEDTTEFVELDQVDVDSDVAKVASIMDRVEGLISDEDIDILTESLPVGSAAAVLVFEHTWIKPLRDAVVNAGGELVDTIRVPGMVVQEILDTVAEIEEEEK
ncbi:DUF6325 family protein [Demequina oxidasica]|uniref:DUF6325 family protein n=1 Tax=Demequina oxidasica TaxID=676199 RepID=UPI0007852023|nr:DUF6325 family protein [Demequina oxidasica]